MNFGRQIPGFHSAQFTRRKSLLGRLRNRHLLLATQVAEACSTLSITIAVATSFAGTVRADAPKEPNEATPSHLQAFWIDRATILIPQAQSARMESTRCSAINSAALQVTPKGIRGGISASSGTGHCPYCATNRAVPAIAIWLRCPEPFRSVDGRTGSPIPDR